MGFSRERPGKDGKVRYAALYRDVKGRQRSAGTFVTQRRADRAWQRAEASISLLRVRDLEFSSRMLTVSRAVAEVHPRFHPDGGRFLVKEYPKDREYRRLKLSVQITAKLKAHVTEHALGRDDLIFRALATDEPRIRKLRLVVEPDSPGRTDPNGKGRRYKHGTMTGYSLGRCRCAYCRSAYARYRAERRATGKDNPASPRSVATDGHLPRGWFRVSVWLPALRAANLEVRVRTHDLRHAHASWLLAGGADLQVVRQRLGRSSLRTTERYLHTLPDADDTALDALAKIRSRAQQA